jgi:hypothetical protein
MSSVSAALGRRSTGAGSTAFTGHGDRNMNQPLAGGWEGSVFVCNTKALGVHTLDATVSGKPLSLGTETGDIHEPLMGWVRCWGG